jgi:hypothetical protein
VIAKKVKRNDPGTFTALAKYVAAAKEPGEKLDDLWIVGAKAGEGLNDLNLAIREVEAQQALNTRSTEDKQYHLIVSFREDDQKPSAEAMRDIERQFAKALGFNDHPRVVGTHSDTDNYHMHVAYSRIHPKTFKAYSPHMDFFRLEKVCRLMEKKYGLQVDLGPSDKTEADKTPTRARDMEAHSWEQSFHSYIDEHKEKLLKARKKARTWQDMHEALAKYDLALKKRGNGLVITSQDGEKHVKASSLDRSFSKNALEKDLGPYKGPERTQERRKCFHSYKRRPITKHPLQGRLWQQYIGQRKKRPSLIGKAYNTWREFLMMGVDDPLAMAIIIFHKEMMKTAFGHRHRSPTLDLPSIPAIAPTLSAVANGRVSKTPPVGQPEDSCIYLDVPFEDRELVKALGAKWDRNEKSWYAPEQTDIDLFKTWALDDRAPANEQGGQASKKKSPHGKGNDLEIE